MKNVSGLVLAAAGLLVLAAACSSSGAGGRRVDVTQTDDGCAPASIAVTAGEKLNLTFKNTSSSDAYEVEGIEGTGLEEAVIHQGKTLSVGYTVPSGGAIHKIKCYVPAGVSTIIELVSGNRGAASPGPTFSAATPAASSTAATGDVDTSVAVTLLEYSVTADKPAVSAGKILFIATNASSIEVHELAVLKVKPDGSFDNLGEVERIDPQKGGSVTLDLAPGAYQLACLIAPGEAGSTVDHYQQGMHSAFTVQ